MQVHVSAQLSAHHRGVDVKQVLTEAATWAAAIANGGPTTT
jgi:hypothetical protein